MAVGNNGSPQQQITDRCVARGSPDEAKLVRMLTASVSMKTKWSKSITPQQLDTGNWILDTRNRILDTRNRIPGTFRRDQGRMKAGLRQDTCT